jgi:glutaryl-CoA transferase
MSVEIDLEAGPGWPADEPAEGPLAGVRVLDLSRVLAGPFATMVLGDLGADVLKIERPGTGDDTRRWGPPFAGEDAAYFASVNRNRRSLTVDLGDPDGAAIVRCLARNADVVVENFLPRHLASLGLEELRDEGAAVWVSVRGAGGDGPDAGLPGYDVMVQARSGLMGITGHPGTGPTKVGVAIADVVSGLYAAVAALAGLVGRSRGPAPVIEVPLLESAISALVNQAANYLIGGVVPGPLGNDHPNLSPYGPIECADRPLVIGAGNDAQFARLCDAVGRNDLTGDPRFATNADRLAHREALSQALAATLATAPAASWQARLEAGGVPCAQVNTMDAVFADPHVTSVGLVQEVDGVRLVRTPLRVDGTRARIRRPPPTLGEHTAEVLAALGLDTSTVAKLRDRGAC